MFLNVIVGCQLNQYVYIYIIDFILFVFFFSSELAHFEAANRNQQFMRPTTANKRLHSQMATYYMIMVFGSSLRCSSINSSQDLSATPTIIFIFQYRRFPAENN